MEDSPFEIVSLYGPGSKKRCMEYALVLQAVGILCEVLPRDGEYALVVHGRDADRAREQLQLYQHENQASLPRFDPRLGVYDGLACACQAPSHASVGASTAVFATLGILAAYSWTRRWTRLSERQDKLAKDWR
jgi:hypothetical protein